MPVIHPDVCANAAEPLMFKHFVIDPGYSETPNLQQTACP
jgi:hypothetical protein